MGATFPLKLAPALAGLAILLEAGRCCADDAQELELAKNRFNAGQYDEAHQQFSRLLEPSLPPCDKGPSGACRLGDADLIERTRVLDAASLIALKRPGLADAQIEKVLRQNPAYAPSPALFPQEVVDRFTEVRGRLREELEKLAEQQAHEALKRRLSEQQAREAQEKWISDLQRLAGQERQIESSSRWVAMIPLGVGQYQNGDVRLGALFTTSEILLGATSLVSAVIVQGYSRFDSTRPCDAVCYADLNSNISTAATVNRISFGALVGVALTGIIQAQVAFVPEKVTPRVRAVPPRPKVAPTVSMEPGRLGVGIVGSF
jgi:tetratricopeptide (TPR) repeat protein